MSTEILKNLSKNRRAPSFLRARPPKNCPAVSTGSFLCHCAGCLSEMFEAGKVGLISVQRLHWQSLRWNGIVNCRRKWRHTIMEDVMEAPGERRDLREMTALALTGLRGCSNKMQTERKRPFSTALCSATLLGQFNRSFPAKNYILLWWHGATGEG